MGTGPNTQRGSGVLLYTPGASATLSWRGGEAVPIPAGDRVRLIVPDLANSYLMVEAVRVLLPTTTTSEDLYIDVAVMSDEYVLREILAQYHTVEDFINVKLEPTMFVSNRLIDPEWFSPEDYPAYWDEVVEGSTYFRPADFARWLEVKMPVRRLLHVYKLVGYFNRTKTVDMSKDWIVIDEPAGMIQLVPSNLAIVNWVFYGVGFYTFFVNYQTVPAFWQFELIAGYREIPEAVRDFIAKRAAMALLTEAGTALHPTGDTGGSLSRDGVTESRAFAPRLFQAIDLYMEQTGITKDGHDTGMAKLRSRYRGLSFTTL
jgi:hypothetical protein